MVPAIGQSSRQPFVRREDLLDDDVEQRGAALRASPAPAALDGRSASSAASGRARSGARARRCSRSEVLLGIVQAVDVVDPQAVDAPSDQVQHQPVGRLEHRRQLDADAGQLVDLEEAAVIDLLRRDAPVGEPVVLRLQQLVRPKQALGSAGRRSPRAYARSPPPAPACARPGR